MTAKNLHPVLRGQKLSELQKDAVNEYIFHLLDSNGLESFRLFTSDEGIFASLKNKNIRSKTYWFYAMRHHFQLAEVATKLLLISASTAQLAFIFELVICHNETRNRLESSKKLINVYFSLRSNDNFIDEEDFED